MRASGFYIEKDEDAEGDPVWHCDEEKGVQPHVAPAIEKEIDADFKAPVPMRVFTRKARATP